jgi:hypothetical protein
MTQPMFGRQTTEEPPPQPETPPAPPRPGDGPVDLGRVAIVFICFGLLGLITAFVLSWPSETYFSSRLTQSAPSLPKAAAQADPELDAEEAAEAKAHPVLNYALVGPFVVRKANQVLLVRVQADMAKDGWTFVESEVLDARKDYLFSFGKELWHETGVDDEGPWTESDRDYEMKITIPVRGTYYLNIKTQGDQTPDTLYVSIGSAIGSSLPHLWFGIVVLGIGLVLNEVANRTILRLMGRFS